jgi:hypothetical protein
MRKLKKSSIILALILSFFCSVLYGTNAAAQNVTVTILNPADGDTFEVGTPIYFSGEGTVTSSDYNLTGSDLVWMSSLDGRIGTGTFFSTSSLSVGHHIISLIGENEAVDSVGIDVVLTSSPSTPAVTSGSYATYNMATNTLYVPFSPMPGVSYWINMRIISFVPLQLELTGIGENSYDPGIAYATFNFFTGALHVPDFRDTAGYSYWLDLKMDPSSTPFQFELWDAGVN